MNWLPLMGLLLFAAIGVGWRSWLHRRRHGSSGIVMFRSGSGPQTLREAMAILAFVLLGAQAVRVGVDPRSLDALRIAPALPPSTWLGAVALLAGVGLMAVAQLDLGASWRIGIEERARPGLVIDGLYRFCRNPIFLAMFVVLAGFALLVPTWLSLAVFLGTYLGIRSQVRAEERYLLRAYGEAYAAYAAKVGRFLPGVGRLTRPIRA